MASRFAIHPGTNARPAVSSLSRPQTGIETSNKAGTNPSLTFSSSSGVSSSKEPTLAHSRAKRHPRRTVREHTSRSKSDGHRDSDVEPLPTSPPPSYASVAAGHTFEERQQALAAKITIIESILSEEDLYKLLGVKRSSKPDEIRRGFLNRSRSCHPDKFPKYAPATEAFQKVSFAYETLSKPSSRRMYDLSGRTDFAAAVDTGDGHGGDATSSLGDDTLNGVLYSVFCEFMEGDFEMIGVLVNALNEGNSAMNLGEDAVDSIENVFKRLRDIMLAGKHYLSIIRFEVIRLYEIQQSLRQLSYFNISGRLKLTLQLARVTISIPLAIDQAMKNSNSSTLDAAGKKGPSTGSRESVAKFEDSESEEEEDNHDHDPVDARKRSHLSLAKKIASSTEFGVVPKEDGDSDSDSNIHSEHRAKDMARARRKAARTKRMAACRQRKANIRDSATVVGLTASLQATNTQALQKRGLLPISAVGLLRGVVKMLETSEAWVPGAKVASAHG